MVCLEKLLLLVLTVQLVNSQKRHSPKSKETSLKKANEGDYPYQVQLRIRKTQVHSCGGVILNTYIVLTAAHCVYPQIKNGTLDQIEVVAGEHELKKQSGHEQVVQIHEAFVHENYNAGAKIDDIALLVLQTELNFNKYVRSIPIPKNVSSTENATLSGWGRKNYKTKDGVNVLHNINLTIYDDMKCNDDWERQLKVENKSRDIEMTKVLCARHLGKSKDTKMTSCNGDSGSPLTCNDGVGFLCGITSGSDRACGQTSNTSGLFANVLSHFDWITDIYNQLELRYDCPCNYFRCINQFCVDPSSLNNGIDDCGDGSDEEKGIRELFHKTGHNYKNWDIESTKYKCHYTLAHPERFSLIDTEYVCDGMLDCPANQPNICADYKQNPSLCSITTAQTETLDPSKINNCNHLTDESNCQVCKTGSIKCPNENKCIRNQRLCNGVRNCNDGSDEMKCDSCSSPKFNFHCNRSRTCVNIQRRCDGKRDCAEGEDEENCNKCKNSFLCSQDQKCILKNHRCNGVFDCSDESDEKDCEKCTGFSFHCKPENKCISILSRCDGKEDCLNNEDERDCDKCSKESLFHCSKSRRCIEANLRCDGETDCEDYEDEAECPAARIAGLFDYVYTDSD